jgi:hypothetical protein
MDLDITSSERYYLTKLDRVLYYQLSSSVLFILMYVSSITLVLAIIAAVIFLPYMIYIFIRVKKIAWLIWLLIIVIIPLVSCIIFARHSDYLNILVLIPLAMFYFYCSILKFSVKDQLSELTAKEELQLQKDKKERELNNW